MKRSLLITGLVGLLALTACTSPAAPPATNEPPKAEQPAVPQTAQVEGQYVLDLKKPSGPNLRLWTNIEQSGTTLTGEGYAGYVTSDGPWMEPYSGQLTGEVSGSQVKFDLRIYDFYDTNEEVRYEFVGVMGDKKLSGTWKRVFITGYGGNNTGRFEGVIWKQN